MTCIQPWLAGLLRPFDTHNVWLCIGARLQSCREGPNGVGPQCLRENRRYSGILRILSGSWWEPPASAGGAGLQSSGKAFHFKEWALALGSLQTSAKAHDQGSTLSRSAEALLPRMNAGAPTKTTLAKMQKLQNPGLTPWAIFRPSLAGLDSEVGLRVSD